MKLEVNSIKHPIANQANILLSMARADKIHPLASGNKFYKLMPNLEYAKSQGIEELISFGGAFSNHIHALALMAKAHGFKCHAIIRGEADYANNPTLTDVQAAGTKLEFVSREEYKRRYDKDYLEDLQQRFPKSLIIPEGGSSELAVTGCMRLAEQINAIQSTNIITVACGTGATFAGVVCGLNKKQIAYGYSALKDKSLLARIEDFLALENCHNNYQLVDANYGGFAKLNQELILFVIDWLEKTGVLLDPIYTSKMCMRLMEQIAAGEFKTGTSITIIHSGGLQGWRGMKQGVIKLSDEKTWNKIHQAFLTGK